MRLTGAGASPASLTEVPEAVAAIFRELSPGASGGDGDKKKE